LYNQDLDPNNDDDVLVGSTINPSNKEKTPTETSQESPKNLEQATRENSDNPINESKLEDRSLIYQKRKQDTSRASSASDYFKTKTPVNESRDELLGEFITPEINAKEMRNNYGK
jgi:hypothetical protein